jgi:membrane-bound metal-dependent hydrolase YbcI (DUF457 family)
VLGHDHALSGACAGLAAGILLHRSLSADAALAGFTAGFATFPDLDKCGSGPARCLGPVSECVAFVVGKVSGGHRHLTHSVLGLGIFTALAWAACHYRADDAGKAGLMLLLTLGFAAALWGLHVANGLRGEVLALIAAGYVTWSGTGLALVGLACTLGCAIHVAGDLCTDSGCMLAYPLSQHRFHLLPEPLAFTTGTDPETRFVAPLLLVTLIVLSAWAADPSAVLYGWHHAVAAL